MFTTIRCFLSYIECKVTNISYVSFLEDQLSKIYCEFCNLSYPNYHADDMIALINEKQQELYEDLYKSDLEDIISDYRGNNRSKEDLVQEIEEYFGIDKKFIEERRAFRERWNEILKGSFE